VSFSSAYSAIVAKRHGTRRVLMHFSPISRHAHKKATTTLIFCC